MWLYESDFLGLRMQIPDGWNVRTWPDSQVAEFAQAAISCQEGGSSRSCRASIQPLMFANLCSPGAIVHIDGCIEFQLWAESDDYFLKADDANPLQKWDVNGIETLYRDDFKERSPECMYYRFSKWKRSPGLWFYATILASGKARFDHVLSVFETLAAQGTNAGSVEDFPGLPWNAAPTFFRLTRKFADKGPLHDLVLEGSASDASLNVDQLVLDGKESPEKWTPLHLRRKGRVKSCDCYYGPQDLYSSGIFSSRAIDLLRPHLDAHFVLLPCSVNKKEHFFLCPTKNQTCLDAESSEIQRFQDGGIMKIKRYRFQRDLVPDPLVFSIPEEQFGVFVTASIPRIVAESGLTGIALYPIDGNGREFTCPG